MPVTTAPVAERPRAARGRYAAINLTEGSISRGLWTLAWPQMVEQVLTIVYQLTDLAWAGQLGARSIAGLGVAQTYSQLAMTGRMGFDTATRAMIARSIGAGDIRTANHVALQSFTLSSAFSVLMMVVGVILTEPLMQVLGVSGDVIAAGADYMRIQFVAQTAIAFRMMSGSALQASGDTFTPMKATTVTRVIHIGLSPCLVFGWLIFPEMGLAGAAIANCISQLVGGVMNFRALFRGSSRLHLNLSGYQVDLPLLWQIAKLGMPASVTSAERTLAQLMLLGIVAPFGDNVLAAFSLTRRTEMVANMGVGGLGQSAGIMAAQNLGAGKPARARSAVLWALLYSSLFLLTTGALLYFFAEPVLSVFNDELGVLDTAVVWLRIQVVGYVFMGAGMVFMQTFNTSGDTTVPMVVTLISIWLVQQPLALVMPAWTGLGEYGIGWAINIAMFVRCFVFLGYYLWGPWTQKRVLGVRAPH